MQLAMVGLGKMGGRMTERLVRDGHEVVVHDLDESLGLLAIVVLIRTFLSMSLFVEVEGRWPWQPERGKA